MMDNPEKEIQQDEKSQEILSKNKQNPMKKKKKTFILILVIFAVLVCVAAATIVLVFKVIIPNQDYKAAVALMESGDYEAAISAFEAMNGYKDSLAQIDSCKTAMGESQDSSEEVEESQNSSNADETSTEKTTQISKAQVGDIITFGTYEQDNNLENGQEKIRWIVLDKTESQILVISRYALDCQQYNTPGDETTCPDVSWETCTLRYWLNSTFLKTAFTETEQNAIPEVDIMAEKNPDYDTYAGGDTRDRIFLLSISEAKKYFDSDDERQCGATFYSKAQGAYTEDATRICWWWLRSPGQYSSIAANVNCDGAIYDFGNYATIKDCCVRPAMWITIE